ncbi:MAG: hypothetical protein IKK77_01195 [Clostridia bacterium]|nr:hypothetical protein [Clostridia bacterium]
MEENVKFEDSLQQPDCDEANLQPEAENTNEDEGLIQEQEGFVEVKYNKEIKKLTLSEAATLAQKGMKLDSLMPIMDKLKRLSKTAGMSVDGYISYLEGGNNQLRKSQLLKECGGNEELTEHILALEEGVRLQEEFEEIKAEFPQISSLDELPEEVKSAAKLKGTGLLFEHLLFQHRLRKAAEEELGRKEKRAAQSLGSVSANTRNNAVDAEFLKGVWGK